MGTLPRHFGRHMLTFEGLVYGLMRQFSPQYTGGIWAYLELSNGSFYMTPPPDKTYCLTGTSTGCATSPWDMPISADFRGHRLSQPGAPILNSRSVLPVRVSLAAFDLPFKCAMIPSP
jgi:hypothetical protein